MSADSCGLSSIHAEKARYGVRQIKEAILALLHSFPEGLSNAEIAKELELKTGEVRGQKNYLTWSILQEMVASKELFAVPRPQSKRGILYILSYGKGAPE